MEFNYLFEISSCVICLVLLFNFIYERKIPSIKTKIFFFSIITSFFTAIFNILTVILLDFANEIPIWISYLVSIVYYLFQTCSTLLILIYVLYLTNMFNKLNKLRKILFFLPAAIYFILVVTTPITHLIFYFDENCLYTYGEFIFINYLFIAFYYIMYTIILIVNSKSFDKRTIYLISISYVLSLTGILIQIFNTKLLIAGFFMTTSLLVIYLMLETIEPYFDRETGFYNLKAFKKFQADFLRKKDNFSLLIFTFDNNNFISSLFGLRFLKRYQKELSLHLNKLFNKNEIFSYSENKLLILCPNELINTKKIEKLQLILPLDFQTNNTSFSVTSSLIRISEIEKLLNVDLLSFINFIVEDTSNQDFKFIEIDQKYLDNYLYQTSVVTALKKAIKNNSFDIYFQPIVDLKTNEIDSCEVLARLIDSEIGYISPGVFIEIAEKNGLINDVGQQIFEKSCQFLSEHNLSEYGLKSVEINLSVSQCMISDIDQMLIRMVEKYNIDPNFIRFEITESAKANSIMMLKNVMDKLINYGFSFALDDYGTGYSNIEYIMKLPFKYIKTDKSLLWETDHNIKSTILFKNLISLIKDLDVAIISEGVETEKHIAFLNELNVNFGQGFIYSKPINSKSFIELLQKKALY